MTRRRKLHPDQEAVQQDPQFAEAMALATLGEAVFYHVLHACGHDAYWSDARLARLAADEACPWCSGEKPDDLAIFGDGRLCGLVTLKRLNLDRTLPFDIGLKKPMRVRHRGDFKCCAKMDPMETHERAIRGESFRSSDYL